MKVSLKWLKEYVDAGLSPAELARKLTMAGTEVKGWQAIGGSWEGIVVGQIVAINPHPNADRLSLPTVDLGAEQLTVVCGASNFRIGDKVAFARVGAELIDGHSRQVIKLEAARIRGIVSNGMLCSERELGISDNHQEIMILAADAPVGRPLAEYMGDVIFDLEVTPNRPDCLSVIGVAREVAALTGQKVRLPDASYEEKGAPIEQQIAVEIAAPDLCPRYSASLITGVKVAPSPQWLQQRLLAGGMRPINNVVDVTNFVMLEYGEPLHAFDYSQIKEKKIIVRRAEKDEVLVTLDGNRRSLSPDMLVIADTKRAVAVAGVMGGADSEMTDQTTSIVLEAANFNPASIYHTGYALGLPSEARMRFERGISPELTIPALRRATKLIIELGGGQAAGGIVDAYPGRKGPKPILLSRREIKRQLGVDFSMRQIEQALTSLGFDCQPTKSASEIQVTAPYWRSDISLVEDLVEEVARIIGYDRIPITMPRGEVPRQHPLPMLGFKDRVRSHLTGYGFYEIITYSLTSLEWLNRLMPQPHPIRPEPLRVLRPMSTEQEYLRPTLRVSLLAALETNRRHEDGAVRLFELGRVYLRHPDGLPDEPEMLCAIMAGPRFDESWHSWNGPVDFFDAKGVVEGLLRQLGVTADFKPGEDESLNPARQAAIVIEGKRVGVVGEVHHRVVEAFDLAEPVYLLELNLAELLPFTLENKLYQPISRFPAVVRDIALVLSSGVTNRQVVDIITGFPLVTGVSLFDLYTGGKLPPGKKSLAYRITFQSPSKTLTDEAVNKVQQQIIDKLAEELGATLRG